MYTCIIHTPCSITVHCYSPLGAQGVSTPFWATLGASRGPPRNSPPPVSFTILDTPLPKATLIPQPIIQVCNPQWTADEKHNQFMMAYDRLIEDGATFRGTRGVGWDPHDPFGAMGLWAVGDGEGLGMVSLVTHTTRETHLAPLFGHKTQQYMYPLKGQPLKYSYWITSSWQSSMLTSNTLFSWDQTLFPCPKL